MYDNLEMVIKSSTVRDGTMPQADDQFHRQLEVDGLGNQVSSCGGDGGGGGMELYTYLCFSCSFKRTHTLSGAHCIRTCENGGEIWMSGSDYVVDWLSVPNLIARVYEKG